MLVPSFGAIGASAANCGPLHLAFFAHIESVCLAESTDDPRLKLYVYSGIWLLLGAYLTIAGFRYQKS